MRSASTFGAFVVMLLVSPSGVVAQPVAASLEGLQVLTTTKARVTVTDMEGQEYRGTIVAVSGFRLSIEGHGGRTRSFGADEVRSVRARTEDSIGNGALIGAAVAGGLASLEFLDNECDAECIAPVAFFGGIGALAGIAVDSLIHRQALVYSAAPHARAPVRLEPIVHDGRKGVRLTVRF